jgi:site-specific recombinase XerC
VLGGDARTGVDDPHLHGPSRRTTGLHAHAAGRTLAEVRDAAGHANIATTSIYAHTTDDDGKVGNILGLTA